MFDYAVRFLVKTKTLGGQFPLPAGEGQGEGLYGYLYSRIQLSVIRFQVTRSASPKKRLTSLTAFSGESEP